RCSGDPRFSVALTGRTRHTRRAEPLGSARRAPHLAPRRHLSGRGGAHGRRRGRLLATLGQRASVGLVLRLGPSQPKSLGQKCDGARFHYWGTFGEKRNPPPRRRLSKSTTRRTPSGR